MRNGRGLTATLLLLFFCGAEGIGLGALEVQSHLGQPFEAELMVVVEPGVRFDDVVIEEAGVTDYRRMEVVASGYTFLFDLDRASPTVNGYRIPVTADRAVQDLFIDLVLVLRYDKTRQIRHYAVLLDPPPVDTTVVQQPAPPVPAQPQPIVRSEPEPEPGPEPEARTRPAAETARRAEPAPAPRVVAGDSWQVRPGDTLFRIAEQVRGDRTRADVSADILALNPRAFIGGDPDRLLAGVRLRLPEGALVPAEPEVPPATVADVPAVAEPREDRSGVVAGVAREELRRSDEADRVRLRAPPGPEEIDQRLGDWMDGDDAALLAQASSVQRDIAYARTEVTTIRNENENLRERVSLLEDRIRSLTRLIELRREDAAVAAADAPAQPSSVASPAAAPEAAQEPPSTAAGRRAAASPSTLSADSDPGRMPVQSASPALAEVPEQRSAALWPWFILGLALVVMATTIVRRIQRQRRARRQARDPRLAGLRDWSDPTLLPDDL